MFVLVFCYLSCALRFRIPERKLDGTWQFFFWQSFPGSRLNPRLTPIQSGQFQRGSWTGAILAEDTESIPSSSGYLSVVMTKSNLTPRPRLWQMTNLVSFGFNCSYLTHFAPVHTPFLCHTFCFLFSSTTQVDHSLGRFCDSIDLLSTDNSLPFAPIYNLISFSFPRQPHQTRVLAHSRFGY